MPFRPYSTQETGYIESLIVEAEKRAAREYSQIASLKALLNRGAFVSEPEDIPKPKPHCYLCKHSTAVGTCRRGYTYGITCDEYKHFHDD